MPHDNKGYFSVLNKARDFYNRQTNLELDEFFLWRRIVDIEPGFENYKLRDKLYGRMRSSPFYKLIDKNYNGRVKIGRNFTTKSDVDKLFRLKIFYNQFYYGESNRYFTDPWDDIMLKALYCNSSGFDSLDWEVLKLLKSKKGDYYDTHYLLGLLLIEKNGCYDDGQVYNEIQNVVNDIVKAQEADKRFSDLYVERIVFLKWADRGDLIKNDWIENVFKNFNYEKRGWSDIGSISVNAHTTGLAVLSLLNIKEAVFW